MSLTKGEKPVLIVGVGAGTGNAVLRKIPNQVPVIGISKREQAGVPMGEEGEDPDRYIENTEHIAIDLTTADIAALAREIIDRARGKLRSIVFACGPGYLQGTIDEENAKAGGRNLVEEMDTLNYRVPLQLLDQLLEKEALDIDATVIYYTGVFCHEVMQALNLVGTEKFGKAKLKGLEAMKTMARDRFIEIMLAHYQSEMLQTVIRRVFAELVWYSAPAADPYAKGGATDVAVNFAVNPKRESGRRIIRPRAINYLLKLGPNGLKKFLPRFIRACAPAILDATQQTLNDHGERIAFHRGRSGLYTPEFCDAIAPEKLVSLEISRRIVRVMGSGPLAV